MIELKNDLIFDKEQQEEVLCGSVTMTLLPELIGIRNLLNVLKEPTTLDEKLQAITAFGANTKPEIFNTVIMNWLRYCDGLTEELRSGNVEALIFLAKLGQFVDFVFAKVELSESTKNEIFAYWIEIGRFDLVEKFNVKKQKQK